MQSSGLQNNTNNINSSQYQNQQPHQRLFPAINNNEETKLDSQMELIKKHQIQFKDMQSKLSDMQQRNSRQFKCKNDSINNSLLKVGTNRSQINNNFPVTFKTKLDAQQILDHPTSTSQKKQERMFLSPQQEIKSPYMQRIIAKSTLGSPDETKQQHISPNQILEQLRVSANQSEIVGKSTPFSVKLPQALINQQQESQVVIQTINSDESRTNRTIYQPQSRIIENYHFHKQHFKEERKQQMVAAAAATLENINVSLAQILSNSEKRTRAPQHKKINPLSIIEETVLSRDNKLHSINKIPSKQQRLLFNNTTNVSPKQGTIYQSPSPKKQLIKSPKYQNTELEQERFQENKIRQKLLRAEEASLEKYIDTEIYVPKILHEENHLKNLLIEQKIIKSPVIQHHQAPAVQQLPNKEDLIKLQNEHKRKFDERLKKDIEAIERRLGLRKLDGLDNVKKLINQHATTKNIDLLATKFKEEPRSIRKIRNETSSIQLSNSMIEGSIDDSIKFKFPNNIMGQPISKRSRQNQNNTSFNLPQIISQEFTSPLQEIGKRKTVPEKSPQYIKFSSPQNIELDADFDINQFPQQIKSLQKSSLSRAKPSINTSNINSPKFDQSQQHSILRSSKQSGCTIDVSVITSKIKEFRNQSPRLKIVEKRFFPDENNQNNHNRKAMTEKDREVKKELKQILIGILDEATKPEEIRRKPPSFYDMIMKKQYNNDEFLKPDKMQMKRVLQLLQRWYKYKDPFQDKTLSGNQAEAISNVYLKKPTVRFLQRQNIINGGSTHNIHNPKDTDSESENSFVSEEDVELYIKDEEVTINVSDSSEDDDAEKEEEALLNIEDERELMVQIQSKIKRQGLKTHLGLLVKCLNMILLHKSDPFLAKKHNEYLRYQRRKKQEEKEKNFYQRMQEDIRKREEAQLKAAKEREQSQQDISTVAGFTRRGTIARLPTNMSVSGKNQTSPKTKQSGSHMNVYNPNNLQFGLNIPNLGLSSNQIIMLQRRQTTVRRLIDFQELMQVSGVLPNTVKETEQQHQQAQESTTSILVLKPPPRRSKTKVLKFNLNDSYIESIQQSEENNDSDDSVSV